MLTSLLLCLLQGPPAPPPPPREGVPAPDPAASAGLKPGVIPEGTSAEARSRYEALCAATWPKDAVRKPIVGFDVTLDVRVRQEGQTNEALRPLRYRWASPGFVRFTTSNERELLRGPKGDFLIDAARREVLPLVGRELAEDRRQLEEWAKLSRNFVSLSDPSSLRLSQIRVLEQAPAGLPASRRTEGLLWLALASPDFQIPGQPTDATIVELGMDAKTMLARLCVVSSFDGQRAVPRLLLACGAFRTQEGRVVPQEVALHMRDEQRSAFEERPSIEFWLKKNSSFEPSFEEATFLPPAR